MENVVNSFTVTVDHEAYEVVETVNEGAMRFYVTVLGQELIFESNENADLRPVNNNTIDPDLVYGLANAIESYLA